MSAISDNPNMAEEALGAAQGKLKPTLMWWPDHRLRYNAGLLVACAIGFFLYDVAVSRCIALKVSGDWEISGFTLFGQVVFYAVMLGWRTCSTGWVHGLSDSFDRVR
ncbi:MAG: hypothetical protein WBD87_00510 [Candidatus Acidiferrales bacterium]